MLQRVTQEQIFDEDDDFENDDDFDNDDNFDNDEDFYNNDGVDNDDQYNKTKLEKKNFEVSQLKTRKIGIFRKIDIDIAQVLNEQIGLESRLKFFKSSLQHNFIWIY